ncbi:hypothetical protein FRB91_011175 [Serendipita sp. 411]|nr:hypothetical protein FRB91_011175 [Serendipita sp. 411]
MSAVATSTTPWTAPTISVQRSSTDLDQLQLQHQPPLSPDKSAPIDSQWGSNFWVTLLDPQTGAEFYACPATGECSWEPPFGNFVLPLNEKGQWWELSDDSRGGIPYYYHTVSGETRWEKPDDEFVIPLQIIQTSTLGRRLSVSTMNKRNSQAVKEASIPEPINEFSPELQQEAVRRGAVAGAPKLKVLTDAVGGKQSTSSRSAVDMRQGGAMPSPRRMAPSVPEKLRPRRYTTTNVNQISAPLTDPNFRQTPLADVGGGPIFVESHVNTKRLSTGDHRTLPKNLAQEIQQFQVADFAKRYFSTHRTGLLFRRRVPVEQLMSWQKGPLSSPLLVLNRSLHKDAVKIFKIIQRIMGDKQSDRPSTGLRMHSDTGYTSGRDSGRESEHSHHRPSGNSVMEEERWMLQEGLLHGELRDEIYCQIVKQLSNNPSAESIFKGWQLLCVLVVTFPPSKNFEEYLRSFIRERSTHTEGRVDVMSKYCIAKLRVITKKGPRGKAPGLQEIEIAQDAAFNPSTFGESLFSVMQLQQRTYPNAKIPIILPFLADGILALGGMKSEGIFRVPGENEIVSDLRLRIDRGFYNLDNIEDPHVPASLLKLWLRELQDPLIPDEMYNDCISCSEDPEQVTQMVADLPTNNRRVTLFVISFLQKFLDERVTKVTKMTAVNLAVVFAPNLLRCPSDSMAVVFTNAKYEQAFVHNLLLHLNCSRMDPDYVPTHGLGPQ